jgi:hypothetical protein
VLRSAQWASLSPFAVKLLMELLGQYRGDNNGDLTVAWTLMSKRGVEVENIAGEGDA